jgi:hypothetical protein
MVRWILEGLLDVKSFDPLPFQGAISQVKHCNFWL